MLPQADGNAATRAVSGKPNKTNRLRPEDLSRTPREARIVNVKADLEGNYGAQVICKLAIDGQTKFWYLSIKKNPNYTVLTNKFGHDENEWVDKRLLLSVKEDDFYGNMVIVTEFPKEEKASRR